MVMTRNQNKKIQNLIINNNLNENKNKNELKDEEKETFQICEKNQSNIKNKNDKKQENENENENVNEKKIKKQKITNLNGNSSMMQLAMPVSMMFFNVSKKSKKIKKNKIKKEQDDRLNNDNYTLENRDEYNLYNSEDENDDIIKHDLNCECDDCDEDYDDDEEEDDEDDDDEYYDEYYDEDDEDEEMDELFDYMDKIKVLKNKIPDMKINDELKNKFTQMLKSSNLDDKKLEWFDTLTKIPFGEYAKYNVDINDSELTKEYIKNIYNNLNQSVWGMYDIKEEIINYVAQCITQPDLKPRVLALCGQPGIGKTKIVRDGISKSLERPMRCFSMGGIKDSSTFHGFDYTYVGSKYGTIVQSLIDCKIMNPILFFDELDKISNTKEGNDIENLLIHLTDPVQNYDFNDKYFNGISIDLSKCLLIFSFNDIENISPILRDRLHIINIPSPSVKDKLNIASKFFVKEFLNNFKLNEEEVIFDNEILKYIIDRYTDNENGVRKLKRCIETICMKINTSKLLGEYVKELNLSTSKINITLPIKLSREHIDVLLHVKEFKNDKIPFMYT